MLDPERLDLPSASSFETDVMCPGRRALIATLPPEAFTQPEDEEATRGSLLHKCWELDDPTGLDDEDLEIYETGKKTGEQILAQWCQDFGITEFKRGQNEYRIFLHDPATMKPLTSGMIDGHYYSHDRVLIDERKSLYCSNLTPAERNWQGRVQAVLAAKEYNAKHVRVAFNKAMFGKSDVVDYAESDLYHAERSIFQALWETNQQGAQRKPGNHCRYCVAKPFCKEAAAFAMLPATLSPNPLALTKEDIVSLVAQMQPQDLATMFQRSGIIVKILEAIKERLKGFTDEELSALGLKRQPGRNTSYIRDTKLAFETLRDQYKVSEEELFSALKFSKTELIRALMRDQGWGKAPTEGFYDSKLEPFIEKQRADSSLGVI